MSDSKRKPRDASKGRDKTKEVTKRTSSRPKDAEDKTSSKPKRASSKEASTKEPTKKSGSIKKQEETSDQPKKTRSKEAKSSEKKSKIPDKSDKKSSKRKVKDLVNVEDEQPQETSKPDKARSSSNKRLETPDIIASTEPVVDEGYDDYEDDFEDYEDDFEDEAEEDASSDIIPSHRSESPEELEREQSKDSVASVKSPKLPASDQVENRSDSIRPRTGNSRFDFVKASLSENQMIAFSKTKLREREILKLVSMDVVNYDLFDMAPVKDYEFYMQSYGKSNRTQAAVQTGDDWVDREIQAEEIDTENKWTQHPPTDLVGCGGDSPTTTFEKRVDSELMNSAKLRGFIENASQVIIELLNENLESQETHCENRSELSFSDGFSSLKVSHLAEKCTVTAMKFSQSDPNSLLTVIELQDTKFYSKKFKYVETVMVLWNVNNPELPKKLLVCDVPSDCCEFSPERTGAAFAGLNDGSVFVFDLNEPDTLHCVAQLNEDSTIILQMPTYSTAGLGDDTNAIVSMCTLGGGSASMGDDGDASDYNLTLSYQLAVLQTHGLITVWSVLTAQRGDVSEMDFGLSPGGKLKLVKSSVLSPFGDATKSLGASGLSMESFTAFTMAHTISHTGHFYVGSDNGYIMHANRDNTVDEHSSRGSRQMAYESEFEAAADISCLQFSPFDNSVLLAGGTDGSIRIYSGELTEPVVTLEGQVGASVPVVGIHWSFASPYQFYVLHSNGVIASWDLKHNRQTPMSSEKTKFQLMAGSSKPLNKGSASFVSPTFLCLGSENGETEVHLLKAKTLYPLDDGHKLQKLLDTF